MINHIALLVLFVVFSNVLGQRGAFNTFNRGSRQQQPFRQGGGGGVNTLELPDGAEFIIGGYRPGFSCDGRRYGYYADVANACRVFHICLPVSDENGFSHTLQWSFFCGNQTAFNQEHLTCDFEWDVDCSRSESFYSVNDFFGIIPPKNRF